MYTANYSTPLDIAGKPDGMLRRVIDTARHAYARGAFGTLLPARCGGALSSLKYGLFFILGDIAIVALSLYAALLLRFEFTLPDTYADGLLGTLCLFIAVKIAVLAAFKLYHITWRFVGIRDLWNILLALMVSDLLLLAVCAYAAAGPLALPHLPVQALPRSVFPIDGMLSLLLMSGLRISRRACREVFHTGKDRTPEKRAIILGAETTGESVMRYLLREEPAELYPVAFLDEGKERVGTYLNGLKVFGTLRDLPRAASAYRAEVLIIAVSHPDDRLLREAGDLADAAGIQDIRVVSPGRDIRPTRLHWKNLEEISIENLIGRHTVKIDYAEIEGFLADRVVLITGAGGSIGSEIAMKVCAFNPRRVYLLDIDETELHNLEIRMKQTYPRFAYACNGEAAAPADPQISCIVGDIRDHELIDSVVGAGHPDIIFHAAAYKHVPMMETNSNEAVKVNMFGTWNLARAAVRHAVKKFVMISTDKAVRPTSIMGATKRMAEYICKAYNDPQGTQFISVRFGNVLGSRGSVLPLFLEQLKHGGPLTVTHRDMRRYFMTVHEAVSLVLQAAVMGNGGCVMMLDMGEPVRIVDLACELIRIHGLEPYRDVDIAFVGLRPGEKLFEEMFAAEEGTIASRHEKIFVARDSIHYGQEEIEAALNNFRVFLKTAPRDGNGHLRALLGRYVKIYSEDGGKERETPPFSERRPASVVRPFPAVMPAANVIIPTGAGAGIRERRPGRRVVCAVK